MLGGHGAAKGGLVSTVEPSVPGHVADETSERETEDVLAEVEQLIGLLTAHADPVVGETATALLDRIDVVHRAALTRLMGAIQSMSGDAFVNRLTADPAIRLLLMSYDLLAVDRRTLAEEALDTVRGHLHAHGVDVELLEVLGGVVTVRLHGVPAGHPAHDGARHDVEEALHAGLLGFQELEVQDGEGKRAAPKDSAFLPLESLRRAQRPVYQTVCTADELPDGHTRSAIVGDTNVLVARVGDELFAVRNACGESPLPLDYSTLVGTELTCSWHGCRYDIRTGHRLDRPDAGHDEHLRVLPVRVRDGVVEIVVGTTAAA
jgi:3-phenylpropionate/trans-cinnamate dioxygenase ferredoxin subunit